MPAKVPNQAQGFQPTKKQQWVSNLFRKQLVTSTDKRSTESRLVKAFSAAAAQFVMLGKVLFSGGGSDASLVSMAITLGKVLFSGAGSVASLVLF